MNTIFLSEAANPLFRTHMTHAGFRCATVPPSPKLSDGIASHPDLFMCKMGCSADAPIFFGRPDLPRNPYPHDILYNAACTGKYFIHRLAVTDPDLLRMAKKMDMVLIDVRQGYTKCNTVVVDEHSMITSDVGIFNTLSGHGGIDCLLVATGHVELAGFNTGFLGGASGRVGDSIVFHGALQLHPDFFPIKAFVEERGLRTVWFEEFPLTDIGSVIERGCTL